MAKKAKARTEAAPAEGSLAPTTGADLPLEPLTGGWLDTLLWVSASFVVLWVAWRFDLDVNRVFDVPKALGLKTLGAGAFLAWLLYALFGRGFPWRSIRLYAAPVAALVVVFGVSTLTSIDFWTSLYGVYERQFGFQGIISCAGLFAITATCLRSKRGAIASLGVLVIAGGGIGTYGLLQATAFDPFGFFKEPNFKVYSTLGNATFAGNALALIAPISLLLAVVLSVHAIRGPGKDPNNASGRLVTWLIGVVVFLSLLLLPAILAIKLGAGKSERELVFKAFSLGTAVLLVIIAGIGTHGPEWLRGESEAGRRLADVLAAAGITAAVIGIWIGLVVTRTRGAWVGTAVAVAGGLYLLPRLFEDNAQQFLRAKVLCRGGLGVLFATAVALMLVFPNHVWVQTIKSIPHAFNPETTIYGQGQGTRRYLWAESPRVLYEHDKTLARIAADQGERAKELGLPAPEQSALADTVRKILVWPLGIGIETYRYAFMSHKSKKLEALDPMTNHDNPHNNYLYILASCGLLGLLSYLWLLFRLISTAWRQFATVEHSRSDRALAFGVVTSFFSYTVYSIAGFDSVACSVFLFYLLGTAAVLFQPSKDEVCRPLWIQVRRQWTEWRGQAEPGGAPSPAFAWISAILLGGLLAQTVYGGTLVYRAEQAFVPERGVRPTIESRVASIKKAIEINPRESFYWQTLGSTHADASRQYREAGIRAQQAGRGDEAKAYLAKAMEHKKEARRAFFAGMEHPWAPENIFISLFQLEYSWGDAAGAEHALERGLAHSPHLGPVRANLAALKEQRGAYQEALEECRWVLEVEPGNNVALRVCGHASQQLGQLESAKKYLQQAVSQGARDPLVKTYLAEVEAALAAKATTTSSGSKS